MKLYFFIVLMLGFFIAGLTSQDLNDAIASTCDQEAFEDGTQAIYIKNLSTGQVLTNISGEELMIPASILKLYTTINAWKYLDVDSRYKTWVDIEGTIADGHLRGQVVIKGFGDPSLGSDLENAIQWEDMADDVIHWLKERGIHKVDGIVSVPMKGDLPGIPRGFQYEDIGNYYGAGHYGINVNDNAFPIVFGRNGEVVVKSFDSLAVDFVSADVSMKGSSDQAYAFPHPQAGGMHVTGSIPVGQGDFEIHAAIQNPPEYLAQCFEKHFIENRIEVVDGIDVWWGGIPEKSGMDDAHIRFAYKSPPLRDIMMDVLHESNNLYAEALYNELIRHDWLYENEEIQVRDGSGLTRQNFITPRALLSVMEGLAQQEYFKEYLDLMPRNGTHGTVKTVLSDLPGKLYIKSGSMGGVCSYAGFHKTGAEEWLAFVCISNGHTAPTSRARKSWEPILEWVARQ